MPASQNNNLNIQNIWIWFQCVECQRCFHALPLLEKHFLEQHKDKRFVLPLNLPSGAREGKLFMKNTSQEKHTELEPQKQLAATTENGPAGQHNDLPASPQNVDVKCAICKTNFGTKSALNFHLKKMHQPISASDISKKIEKKSTSDAELSFQQTKIINGAAQKYRKIITVKEKASAVTKAALKAKRKRRTDDEEVYNMEVVTESEVNSLQDDSNSEDGTNLENDDEEEKEHSENPLLGLTNETGSKEEDERKEDSNSDDNFIPSSGDRDSSSSESDCFDKGRNNGPPKYQANPKRQRAKKTLTSTSNVTNDGQESPVDPKMSEPTKGHKGKDKEPVVCEICGASCLGRKAFHFHMSYHHKGPSWICDVCGKTFRHKSDLKKHEVVHTGEKKFKCHLCPSQYTANRALKKHLVRTHGKEKGQEKTPGEGVLKIKCEYPFCSTSVLSESELRSHIEQIHSKNEEGNVWICKLCGKVFANQQRLTRHDLVHNQVKNHICTVCNRDFTLLHNLQKHLKAVHLKERFPCTQPGCDKKYGGSSNLSEHLRKKHGIYSAKYRAKQNEKQLEKNSRSPPSPE